MHQNRFGLALLLLTVLEGFVWNTSAFAVSGINHPRGEKYSCTMSMRRVAVVTGANKGIGLEIARILGKLPDAHCIMACRNPELGQKAAADLIEDGCNVSFRPLDISDPQSIQRFATMIKNEFGGIDMLVNNAGFAFKGADPTPFAKQARPTLNINYFGTVNVCESLKSLIKDNGRVSIVSSTSGRLSIFAPNVRAQLLAPTLTTPEITAMANGFITDVEAGVHAQRGWPGSTYGASKGFVSAYTRVLARELQPRGVLVNCCCPGYCVTDMTSRRGNRSAAEGAKTPALLATLPPGAPTGEFWVDGAVRHWAQT